MATALLECPEPLEEQHARPCVSSLACWWREIHDLEELLGYARSSLAARDVWDKLMVAEILLPRAALYSELRDCVRVWNRVTQEQRVIYPSLLDRLIQVATSEGLPLPEYAVLAAFRLRHDLSRKGTRFTPGGTGSL